ncbi:hypothetical protein M2103_002696 [Ereboglobus sp. PH5-5]|nr:hypothetical protein [Ereboglobus sp. PH5-5]
MNTLGSTLLIENDGTATLNFSNTQLSIIQAPISEGTIGAGKNKTDRNISSTYPFFQERRGSCVVASLRNVIYAYKGDAPTEAALRTKIANFLGIKESVFDADGLMFGDAKRAIRHILDDYGLNASYHSSPSDIEHAVRLGGPFIVFTRNESSQDSDYATVHAITTWFMPYNQLTYTIDSERPNSRATTGTAEWLSTGEYYQKWNTMGSNVIWPRRTQ